MEIRMDGGGGLWTWKSWGEGGTQAVFEIQVEGRGGQETVPSVGGGVWIFSGIITHYHFIC